MNRFRFLLLLVPVLLGAACAPKAPGVTGQLAVSTEVVFEDAYTLEIRLLPDDSESFDPATVNFSDEDRHRQASWNLTEIEFPFHYDIGGGLGSTEHKRWRVVAWISKSEDVGRPQPGEWYGTRVFSAKDCGVAHSGYCGKMIDVDLEIDSLLFDGASRRVESELGPGEYIEESLGSYTMRCREGNDSARSTGTFVVSISTNGRPITEVRGVRDGTIENCWMADIDNDEKAEVLIFTKSAGSGGFADLHVYKFDGTDLQAVELPDPEPALMDGYQGRDWYELTNDKLLHTFPLYLKEDANCCPGGGTRVIEFDSPSNSWSPTAQSLRKARD